MFKIEQYQNNNLPFDDLNRLNLFIGASGFEDRGVYQAELLSDKIEKGIVLGFENVKNNKIRKRNDAFFTKNNFEILESKTEDYKNGSLKRIIYEINQLALKSNEVNVYIDYSSMTKNWYSFLLYEIYNSNFRNKINLYLGYTHGNYVESLTDRTYNRVVSPLFGYCNLSIPTKPTSLIIGLGNDSSRVFGLKEYFDAVPYIFHTDSSYNDGFNLDAKELLEKVLSQIPSKNIFEFPVNDLVYTNYILENLCQELIKQTRIVIAPCGPKPFAVLAMLMSLKYNNLIEVWRITPGVKIPVINRTSTGLVSVLKVCFEDENG